jgi:hypothetical protein
MKNINPILFIVVLFMVLAVFNSNIEAQYYIRNTTVIDTPTAYTIGRGTYQVSFFSYDDGGLELKTIIGLHDNIFLGVSVDAQNAIGKDEAEPNVPGVIAKLKFTDGWERFPISLAVGYDSFYIGKEGKTYNDNNELNRMIYGPYFAVTKPIYLLDDEQHIHFGVRVPTQPDYVPEDSSYFLSLDVPLGEYFIFKAEGERIYYDFSRNDDWLLNFGIRYSYYAQLGLEFDVILQQGERANRIIRIEYKDEF